MLIGGAESVVRGSVSLGKKLKISLFAIGVVVVAAGTSLPELASCIRTVISDHPDIAVGAAIGSNIANIVLIMGATTILFPILSSIMLNLPPFHPSISLIHLPLILSH